MVHPKTGSDWIQLINPTSQTVSLDGWKIFDSDSELKTLSGNLEAGKTVQISVSNRLNNAGDTVSLKDSEGKLVDQFSYSSDPGIDAVLTIHTLDNPPFPSPTPPTTPTSEFSITTSSNELKPDQSVEVDGHIVTSQPNTTYFLKGVFYQEGSINYFGFTKIGDQWIKQSEHYDKQFQITTDGHGEWRGTIFIKNDSNDSGFSGTKSYLLKVGRYTQAGGGPTWSNSISLQLDAPPPPDPSPKPPSTPTPPIDSVQSSPDSQTSIQITTPKIPFSTSLPYLGGFELTAFDSTPSVIPSVEQSASFWPFSWIYNCLFILLKQLKIWQ